METRDWSLVVFTVLTQAAVGAFLVLQVLEYLAARRAAPASTSGTGHPEDRNAEAGGGRAADGPRNNGPARAGTQDDEPEAGNTQESGRAMACAAHAGRTSPAPLLVVLAVLSAGLFAALFHLSDPLQAARAVVNFSSSWLSREIVFGSLFAALLGALAALEWRAAGSEAAARPARERRRASTAAAGAAPPTPIPAQADPLSPAPANPVRGDSAPASPAPEDRVPANPAPAIWLPRLTAAAGLAFIGCQTAIYLLPAQPAWNSFATPAGFGGTALRLGILGVAAGLVVQRLTMTGDAPPVSDPEGSGRTQAATLRGLALAGIAALALEFVVVPLHLASLAANPLPAAAASVERLTGDYGGVLLLRLGLLGAAASALGGVLAIARRPFVPARPTGSSSRRLAVALTCSAFGLTAASEVCGRFLFYAMQVRVGI